VVLLGRKRSGNDAARVARSENSEVDEKGELQG
jgi:hypothetical protein